MELSESRLGRQEYWDKFYETEIRNFNDNPEDTGECWFDDSGAQDRMVDFLVDNLENEADRTVLDLGTGNGMLLFALREAGVEGEFLGIDYASTSIELATSICKTQGFSDIKFQQVDFLNNPDWTNKKFDIVFDKGTLDAIALSGERDVIHKYARCVAPLVKSEFIITSCNFTKDELLSVFKPQFIDWEIQSLDYPQFTFGGSQGSTVVTLVFKKT